MNANKILKQLKDGGCAKVIVLDKYNKTRVALLRYNKERKKYFLTVNLDSVNRKTIHKREALDLLNKTIYLTQQYEETRD